MDDNKRRRQLSAVVKNPRVRRMLNMDSIDYGIVSLFFTRIIN